MFQYRLNERYVRYVTYRQINFTTLSQAVARIGHVMSSVT